MGIEVGGIVGLLLLAATIWAIVNIVQSDASTGGKVVWILVVLLFSLLGILIWLFFGPRSRRA